MDVPAITGVLDCVDVEAGVHQVVKHQTTFRPVFLSPYRAT